MVIAVDDIAVVGDSGSARFEVCEFDAEPHETFRFFDTQSEIVRHTAHLCRRKFAPVSRQRNVERLQRRDRFLFLCHIKRDRHSLRHHQTTDHAPRPAYVRHDGLPGKRRLDGKRRQDARPLRHQNDAPLRPCPRPQHHERHEAGTTETCKG